MVGVTIVAPLAGAWIETVRSALSASIMAVAPLAGAWIETTDRPAAPDIASVAPLAGAWIETLLSCVSVVYILSRPSRARGLKPSGLLCLHQLARSRPSRARGLKPVSTALIFKVAVSRPSRARGLKQLMLLTGQLMWQVAPLAGAWIETCSPSSVYHEFVVAPLAGAWIETSTPAPLNLIRVRRAPRGRVD